MPVSVQHRQLLSPRSLKDALRMLHDEGPLVPLAGCTDLYVTLNFGTLQATRFLNIWSLNALRGIDVRDGVLRLGALTTFTQLIKSPLVGRYLPMLVSAAREVGGVQIQNRGTLGGNVANASPAGDSLPVLAAAQANIELQSVRGTRIVPFNGFYTGYRKSVAAPDELIVAVHVRRPAGGQWFRKVGTRKAQAIAKIVIAGVGGAEPCIAMGSVAPTVVRLSNAEKALANGASIEEAQVQLRQDIAPIDDVRSTAEYRHRVAANLLAEFWQRAGPRPRGSLMQVVRGRRVVLPEGERDASLHIERGVIVTVAGYADVPEGIEVTDAGDLTISPGLVDTHVHINEPGRTEWEGFDTATRAAAAGGVTTLVDMPLNSVPATTTVTGLEAKRGAARGACHVDVAFWGGIVPGNEDQIAGLLEAGVRGFKCFLTPSGVDEFPAVSADDLRRALPRLALEAGKRRPLLVHAEDPALLRPLSGNPRLYANYLATRPASAEVSAVRLVAGLTRQYDVATHIVHLSSEQGVHAVAAARAAGIAMTAETCPHYLTFSDADIADGATAFKCAPPIRTAADREALWLALGEGVCCLVATDHSPSPPLLKSLQTGDFMTAWGGVASLQLSLPAVWSGARRRGFDATDLAVWMSSEPSRLSGLTERKGRLAAGCDADLVIWDPDAPLVVEGARLEHRHPLTPYEGRTLTGVVKATYLARRLRLA